VAWDQSFLLYRNSIPALWGCFGISIVSSAMTVIAFTVAGRLLGDAAPWTDSFLAGPLVVVANCLPLTPGGIGLAETVSNQLFSGLGSSGGAELMIMIRACFFATALPGIIPIVALFHSSRMVQTPKNELHVIDDCRATEKFNDYFHVKSHASPTCIGK
jgi:uncharacterized membrane protein YbhN (UPF0104 family)